jgi:N-acetylmuramic acid 6-phosphate etherase
VSIGVSCVPDSQVAGACDIAITPVPGPEIVTGSTRLRAGTATKLVLNMLSTATMIRLGYVYGNLMVNVQPSNGKLVDRARRIISQIAGVSYDEAARLLAESGSVRTAIVMHKLKLGRAEAENRLAQAKGRLRIALGE